MEIWIEGRCLAKAIDIESLPQLRRYWREVGMEIKCEGW